MAAKNGCNDATRLLLAHGAFIESKANVLFHHLSTLLQIMFKLSDRDVNMTV